MIYAESAVTPELQNKVIQDGFALVPNVFHSAQVNALLLALNNVGNTEAVRRRGAVFAVRNLLDVCPDVCRLAHSMELITLVEPFLGHAAFPVRGILFDKIPGANWKVPWHQDLTIAVSRRIETDGFGPWSTKADVLHVQPPVQILENMLTVRVHLDDCDESNGPLKVLPGSHRRGRLTEQAIEAAQQAQSPVVCTTSAGGVLLMRPLLLHASSPAGHPGHRRVIHIDYANSPLPNGLEWFSERP